jgi:hypothetical protein
VTAVAVLTSVRLPQNYYLLSARHFRILANARSVQVPILASRSVFRGYFGAELVFGDASWAELVCHVSNHRLSIATGRTSVAISSTLLPMGICRRSCTVLSLIAVCGLDVRVTPSSELVVLVIVGQ